MFTRITSVAVLGVALLASNARAAEPSLEEQIAQMQEWSQQIEVLLNGVSSNSQDLADQMHDLNDDIQRWLFWAELNVDNQGAISWLMDRTRNDAKELRALCFDLYDASKYDRGIAIDVFFLSQSVMLTANEIYNN